MLFESHKKKEICKSIENAWSASTSVAKLIFSHFAINCQKLNKSKKEGVVKNAVYATNSLFQGLTSEDA